MLDWIPAGLTPVFSEAFASYGRVQQGFAGSRLLSALLNTPAPKDEVVYVASDPSLENTPEFSDVQSCFFGGLACQGGYCNGFTTRVDALEYHRTSEWMLLGSDAVLLLGHRWDIENEAYDFTKLQAFSVPAGTALELYATTLHYSPCSATKKEPFRAVIILPRGTNSSYAISQENDSESALLTACNKWVLTSPQAVEIRPLLP